MAYRRSEAWDDLSLRLDEAFRQQRCYASMSYAHTQMLRHRVLSGDVVEPFPRLFVRTEAWKTLSRADQERYVIRGYAQVHPGAVFCSISAAVMHGLPVSYSLLGQVYVYGSSPSHRGGARVVRLYRPDPTCEMVDGSRSPRSQRRRSSASARAISRTASLSPMAIFVRSMPIRSISCAMWSASRAVAGVSVWRETSPVTPMRAPRAAVNLSPAPS